MFMKFPILYEVQLIIIVFFILYLPKMKKTSGDIWEDQLCYATFIHSLACLYYHAIGQF